MKLYVVVTLEEFVFVELVGVHLESVDKADKIDIVAVCENTRIAGGGQENKRERYMTEHAGACFDGKQSAVFTALRCSTQAKA